MWAGLTLGYHVASRLAYVVGVGVALRRQQHQQAFTRHKGPQAGFLQFRRVAATLMNNDAVSFVLLCVVTRQTLRLPVPGTAAVAGGVLLIAIGAITKIWAARCLGSEAYYWHDFFAVGDPVVPELSGPYRFLKNPMYTLGYLQAYGVAVLCGSWPGLLAAGFDQAAILAFHHLVERPHYELRTKVAPRQQDHTPHEQSVSETTR